MNETRHQGILGGEARVGSFETGTGQPRLALTTQYADGKHSELVTMDADQVEHLSDRLLSWLYEVDPERYAANIARRFDQLDEELLEIATSSPS